MGNRVTVEIFGESHSSAIGMTLCGVPAGETIDMDALQNFMDRRAPGRDATATARKEPDRPEFLCGVVDGVTTGAPITAIMHYPPLTDEAPGFSDILEAYGVEDCVYGHLHGAAIDGAVRGERRGVRYHQVSCDGLGFRLYKLY